MCTSLGSASTLSHTGASLSPRWPWRTVFVNNSSTTRLIRRQCSRPTPWRVQKSFRNVPIRLSSPARAGNVSAAAYIEPSVMGGRIIESPYGSLWEETMRWTIAAVLLAFASAGIAADAGEIKSVSGTVHLERGGKKLPVKVGTPVQQSDVVVTGADGAAGITFTDNS